MTGFINRAIDNQIAQAGGRGPSKAQQAPSEAGEVSDLRAEGAAQNGVMAKED